MRMGIIAAVGVMLWSAAAALGQGADRSTYQGVLEFEGVSYDGGADFRFQVFDGAGGGTAVGAQTEVLGVQVIDGLFSAEFEYAEDGVLGEDRWLEIQVRTDGAGSYETLSPRQKITAAPRAQQAKGAEVRTDGAVSFKSGDATSVDVLVCCTNETTFTAPNAGQTFVAVSPGRVTSIEVGYTLVLGDQVEMFLFEGTDTSASPLASAVTNATSTTSIPIANGPALQPGQTYSLVFQVTDTGSGLPGGADWRVEQNDAYPEGDSTFGGEFDLVIAVVTARPTSLDTFVRSDGSIRAREESEFDDAVVRNQFSVIGFGVSSDESVSLPANSINPTETSSEPGVVSDFRTSSLPSLSGATTATTTIDSQTIQAPADGFVVAMANLVANIEHSNGTASNYDIGLTSSPTGSLAGSQDLSLTLPAGAASGSYRFVHPVMATFTVSEGSNTFYLRGRKLLATSPNLSFNDLTFTLMYFPTSYGVVTSAVQAGPVGDDDGGATVRTIYTAEDIELERAAAIWADEARRAAEAEAAGARSSERKGIGRGLNGGE